MKHPQPDIIYVDLYDNDLDSRTTVEDIAQEAIKIQEHVYLLQKVLINKKKWIWIIIY